MKVLFYMFMLLVSITGIAKDIDLKTFNKEFNDALYFIRQSHYYSKGNPVTKIRFYSDNKLIKTLNGTRTINQDINTGKVVIALMKLDVSITRVVLDNHVIDLSNNNLKSDLNESIIQFNNEHIDFSKSIKMVRHDHSSDYTFEDRLERHSINISVGENCAKVYLSENHRSIRMMVRRNIYRYWTNRNVTLHFTQMMMSFLNYFTSHYYYDEKSSYVYSTTLFSQDKVSLR